jgi:hypothetical protein
MFVLNAAFSLPSRRGRPTVRALRGRERGGGRCEEKESQAGQAGQHLIVEETPKGS